jgi:hypothetical protein
LSCFVDDNPSGGQGVEGVLLARSFAANVLSCFVNDSPSGGQGVEGVLLALHGNRLELLRRRQSVKEGNVICFGDVPA